MNRALKLVIALVLGLVIGGLLHTYRDVLIDTDPSIKAPRTLGTLIGNVMPWLLLVGQVFLRLILMIVVPLVFSALILGSFELGASHGFGRVLRKTLVYTVISSTAAVIIGFTLVNLIRPGAGLNRAEQSIQSVEKLAANAAAAKPITQILLELIPRNPVEAAAKALDGDIMAFMMFSLIAGLALSFGGTRERAERVVMPLLEQVMAACMRIVEFAMRLAPYAVFTLVLDASYRNGFGVLVHLGSYALVVVVGLLIQHTVVYSLMLRFAARRSPLKFFGDCREVYLYAFSTSSSNATLPKALECAEKKLGVPPAIARFVLTVGATANQNGTALFEGVTVLFLAQAYGVHMGWNQQFHIILMSIIAGIGTAGVPGGSLPIILILAQSVGVPAEGMGLILGVDRFLDMCRTVVNVGGDLVIAAIVGRDEPAHATPTPAPTE